MNIWQQFSVQTLSEYSDLYLKMVLLLVNIFEIFCDKCIESYGLDPAYYYTLLGFTWDAMLKHTLVNFELTDDIYRARYTQRS